MNIKNLKIRNKFASLVVAGGILGLTCCLTSCGNKNNDNKETTEAFQNPIFYHITLNRVHEIKACETVSQYALDSGCSEYDIVKLNHLESENFITMYENIIIPYTYDMKHLSEFSESVPYDKTLTLEEFALLYETDPKSLSLLNPVKITEVEGNYYTCADTLIVPNFISKADLYKPYQKIKVNND